jgi:subtilisin family serine protease
VGDSPVTVCIVDTGYALGHPDLPLDVTGDDAISKYGDLWDWKIDFNGHGTHVAGTIAALGNNDLGVIGAGKIPLHITRGLDDNSDGFESDVLDAVDQCIAAGAKIISLSLGGDVMSNKSSLKYDYVVNQLGIMVVAASGNQGQSRHAYPASHPAVISVGAVYEWSRFWEGSNYSDQVEFAAPGHGVLSTSTTLSAVHTFDYSFKAEQVGGSRHRERESTLIDCGTGNVVCERPEGVLGGICLMSRDQTTLKTMISNCESAGGVGVIIFDANPNMNQEYHARVDIPVSLVSTSVGIDLLQYVGTPVSLGFHESDEPEHSYKTLQGTSMAVPHVAASAALVWSHFPTCSNQEIRYALAITASDQGMSGCDWDYGHGIVQAHDAYLYLQANPCGTGNVGYPGGGCATTTGILD